ncbi:hypothetical protein [Dyella sp.]|uniref:hypothetical protein n=1 Tax=Dyella sp. TaxID=1869338 RepID=UPI002FDB384A
MMRKLMAAVALTAVLLMSGCATSRSEIKLHSPTVVSPTTTESSGQHVVVIGKITDERVFAEAPDDPSTPTLGFGGADKATAEIKARAVGRKRNTYGKALGDVLLQPGQTVEGTVRENLVAAFEQAGYRVKEESGAGPSPLVVDVHIKQFWSWFTPGVFAVTLSNNIATDLVFNGTGAPVTVSTHVENYYAIATDGDWIETVDKGLDAYRAEVTKRMQSGDVIAASASALVTTTPLPATGATPAAVPNQPPTEASVSAATVVSTPPQSSSPSADPPVEAAAPMTLAVATPESGAATSSEAPSTSSAAIDATPAPIPATSPQDSAATAAITPLAQAVAIQLGCGVVQANGATTFIAPCGDYSVLIDCDSGQCRPMHTVNVKHND